MKDFLENLFQYNDFATTALIQKMYVTREVDLSKSTRLLSHILNAHHIWNCRIRGVQPEFGVWESIPLTEMLTRNEENYQQTVAILSEVDLSTSVSYTNSKGNAFQNTVQDIVFHVVNHSTYHRAQIASNFREQGLEPVPTDYILYKR